MRRLLLMEVGRLAIFDKMQIIVSDHVHILRYVLGARPPENWNRNYSDYVLCEWWLRASVRCVVMSVKLEASLVIPRRRRGEEEEEGDAAAAVVVYDVCIFYIGHYVYAIALSVNMCIHLRAYVGMYVRTYIHKCKYVIRICV